MRFFWGRLASYRLFFKSCCFFFFFFFPGTFFWGARPHPHTQPRPRPGPRPRPSLGGMASHGFPGTSWGPLGASPGASWALSGLSQAKPGQAKPGQARPDRGRGDRPANQSKTRGALKKTCCLSFCLSVRPSVCLSGWQTGPGSWLLAESETQTEIETETDRQPGRQDRDRQFTTPVFQHPEHQCECLRPGARFCGHNELRGFTNQNNTG